MRFKLDVNYLEVEQKVIKKHNCGIISEIKLSKRRGIYHVSSLYVWEKNLYIPFPNIGVTQSGGNGRSRECAPF